MNKHDDLIAGLSRDLTPVSPASNVNLQALVWVLISAIYVVAVTQLFGAARPGVVSQLATTPRFLLESLLGIAAILWFSLVAFRAAIPAGLSRQFAVTGIVLMTLWLAQYVFGLISPALEPSELGKRGHCFWETMAYSALPILSGLFLIRRLYPLSFTRTSMSVALSAAMLPALYMQLACMYEPTHILSYHILPGLLMVAAVGAIVTLWFQNDNEFG